MEQGRPYVGIIKGINQFYRERVFTKEDSLELSIETGEYH